MAILGTAIIKFLFRKLTILTAAGLVGLSACAAPSAQAVIPISGSLSGGDQTGSRFQVKEYALVEQSIDNPTHSGFQDRVPASVMNRRSGLGLLNPQDAVQAPNQALSPFGYHLEENPTPPFSAYALYHGDTLVQSDIARFWPVSLKDESIVSSGPSSGDFLLAYQTTSGERLMATVNGIQPWPGSDQAASPPVYVNDELVYAAVNSGDGALNIYTGEQVSYSEVASVAATLANPKNLFTWGGKHWALELNGRVILDGQDLNQARGYSAVFNWSVIEDQPVYLYTHNGLTRIHYAGHDLPYIYDHVVQGSQGDTAIFNPGGSSTMIWFYALRDGLWYYVEAGLLN